MLRLFGAPDAAVGAAVGQFPPQWNAAAQWKSRGAETLVALSAQSAAGLKKAVGALRETFSADLYGAGETTLAEAVVAALEGHDRLLICSDAAAGTLLEARLETVPGAEKVFDFGALSYAHPKAGAQIEKRARARLPKGTTDPVRPCAGAGTGSPAGSGGRPCGGLCRAGAGLRAHPQQQKRLLAADGTADGQARPLAAGYDPPRRVRAAPSGGHGLSARPESRKNGPARNRPRPQKAPPRPAGAGGFAGAGRSGSAGSSRGVGVHGRQFLRPAPAAAFALGGWRAARGREFLVTERHLCCGKGAFCTGFYRKFIGKQRKICPTGLTGFVLWCII